MPRGAASGRAVLGIDDLVEFLIDMELASDLVLSLDAFEAFIVRVNERNNKQERVEMFVYMNIVPG